MPLVQELLDAVAGRATRAGVEMVFGEPQGAAGRTVIPVARVAFGFGAGGGEMPDGEGGTQARSGGGGGGGGRATPVAVVEITDEGVRILPILDVTRIRLAGFACLGLGLWVLGKALARCGQRRP